jgi:hypothetical protein
MAEQYYGKKFDFYFIVISKSDKECHVYKTSENTMNEGRNMVKVACEKYLKAIQSNIWVEENLTASEDEAKMIVESNYEILEV